MERSRWAACLLCGVLALFALGGCGGGSTAPTDSAGPDDAIEQPVGGSTEGGGDNPVTVNPERFSAGNDTDASDGVIAFDADGDGVAEQFLVEFQDNGDEAPNVMTITSVDQPEVSLAIAGAYEVREVMLVGNDDGSELVYVRYAAGDYYGHDADAWCEVRMADGQLVASEALFGC